MPEHFTNQWRIDARINLDNPYDRFKPPGCTPGHGLEWARLCLHSYDECGDGELVTAAVALFDRALRDGWGSRDQWIYTTTPGGVPWVALEPHWVSTEAVGAAVGLHAVTGDRAYADLYRRFWEHIGDAFLDPWNGSWVQERDAAGRASVRISGGGRTDVYHCLQALVLPRVTWSSSVVRSVQQDALLLRTHASANG